MFNRLKRENGIRKESGRMEKRKKEEWNSKKLTRWLKNMVFIRDKGRYKT